MSAGLSRFREASARQYARVAHNRRADGRRIVGESSRIDLTVGDDLTLI